MQALKLTKKYKKYPEYKDSGVEWLGKVPQKWKTLKGKFVFQNKKEINIGMKNDNVLSLTMNGVINRDSSNNEGLLPSDYQSFQIFEKDDLVFKLIDLENYKTSRVGIVHEKGIMSPVYIRLETKKDYLPKYFYYLYYRLYIEGIYNFLGSGVRSSLSPRDLMEMGVVIPSTQEQENIVYFLDRKIKELDLVITKKQKMIEFLGEKRKATINLAVTKGVDSKARLVKADINGFKEIPEGWDIQKMKFLAKKPLQYGANEAGLNDDRSQPRFIRITDIDEAGNLRQDIFKSLDPELAKPYLLEEGDVLFARTGGTVGKSFRYKKEWGPCCYAGYLIRMNVNQKKISSEYLEYITKSDYYWKWIDSIFIRSTIQNVSAEKYKDFLIALPPIKEQEKILNVLNKEIPLFDEAIKKVEKTIDYLKEFKSSLISSVVTGKIKV
jgi:type I restriction enzyme S subunit